MSITLPNDLIPVIARVREVLDHETPVRQQMVIECLAARHVMQCSDDPKEQQFVIDAIAKHVRQIIGSGK